MSRSQHTRAGHLATTATITTVLAAGCTTPTGPVADTDSGTVAPPVTVASSIPPNSDHVSPNTPLLIAAQNGTLTSVRLTDTTGTPVPGQPDPTGRRWHTTAPLAFETTYHIQADTKNLRHQPGSPFHASFRTARPAHTLQITGTQPRAGETAGIAMPILLEFDKPATDRAAVERHLTVESHPATEGSWHWVTDREVHWRPREFWKPGTAVTVHAGLYGVDIGNGTYGARDHRLDFRIGPDLRVVGDVNAHTLTVWQGNQQIQNFPASYGRPRYPTQSGIHVVTEKSALERMSSATRGSSGDDQPGSPGFYDLEVRHAVRISANGEFVHAAPWSVGDQGKRNVSHGCINLSNAHAKWLFDTVYPGVPVEIIGSPKPLTPTDGPIMDWTLPYEVYRSGSALADGE